MLFEKEDLYKPIKPQWSKYLKDWTNTTDRISVSEKTGVSVSTIRDIISRKARLNKENKNTATELLKLVVINCDNKIEYGRRVKKEIESLL